jgi:hypothetical protein
MNLQSFLQHHGIGQNPFAEEDAQSDPVFKEHCIGSTYHATWEKIYGDPREPATSVVFGEKGAGKTALRLQIARHLEEYNRQHASAGAFVIAYDDFNPFLDRFRDKLPRWQRRADKLLAHWKLWDHIDAILSLGVTRLVDGALEVRRGGARAEATARVELARLDRQQARDLLLLAACYDQSLGEPFMHRWGRLRQKLGFSTWGTRWQLPLGLALTAAVPILFLAVGGAATLIGWLPYLLVAAAWLPWLWRAGRCLLKAWGITRQLRVVRRDTWALARALMHFTHDELAGQPLPNLERTDDRYELLTKFQGVLQSLGYASVVVLVDRVDEPYLVNGSAERMKALLWPLLDNKLLKHPGLGFKLLLPIELSYYVDREEREFYQRARLDKQNLVPSLRWTGEALYDVANARLRACAVNGRATSLGDLFDETLSTQRLIDAFRELRVPRHLFKFLYRLFVAHGNAHSDAAPAWKISRETFEATLALYRRDQEAGDRGAGPG